MYDNLIVILIGEEVYMFLKKIFVYCLCYIYVCVVSFLINFVNYMYLKFFMVYIYILISIVGFIE